jgi:hypothetical protein
MKPIKNYTNIYTPIEIQLAHEIAERLNDPGALTQFLNFAKEYPHDILREALNIACSMPDNKIIVSRAAIFVNRIHNYRDSQNGYPRY